MLDNDRQLLSDAIARNCATVLSLPSAGLLHHQKSRLLSEVADGIWVEANPEKFPLVEDLIVSQQPAGVSFKGSQTKIVFVAPILEINRRYPINASTFVPAVRVAFPDQLRAIQRRNNYRVRIFEGSEISAKIWKIAPRVQLSDRPKPSSQIPIILRDLSLGGIGVTFQNQDGDVPRVTVDDRLRVEIGFRDVVIVIEGRMRKPAEARRPGVLFTGIAFKEMGNDLEGRQKMAQLTRIIGEMQREEVRRARLGTG